MSLAESETESESEMESNKYTERKGGGKIMS